ncbi:hypothetical protein ACEPAH_8534 [Sanghuangporus vaninii]
MGLMDRPGARPSSSWGELLWTSINIGVDCILAVLGKILLLPFVTGPLPLRLRYGFRQAEPTFRVPTQDTVVERLAKLDPQTRGKEMCKEILQAVDKRHVEICTAAFMGIGIWTVDHAPARDALAMLIRKEISEEELALSVWELDGEMRWRVWRVHQL